MPEYRMVNTTPLIIDWYPNAKNPKSNTIIFITLNAKAIFILGFLLLIIKAIISKPAVEAFEDMHK